LVPLSAQPNNNVKNFYRTGSTITNTLAVTGGSEKVNFRLSASRMNNDAIIPNSSFDRSTLNLNMGADISDKLRIEAKANYVNQKGKNRPVIGQTSSQSVGASLNFVPRFVDFEWLQDYKKEDGSHRNWKSAGPTNPYWIINEFLTEDERNRLIGFVSANYKITDWLSIMAKVGTDFYTDSRYERIGQGTPGSSLIDGVVTKNLYKVNEMNTDVILTASHDFSSDFSGTLSL